MELLERLIAGDRRAAAQMISLVENKDPDANGLMKALYPLSGKAYVIGITGPPGAGKSTLTDKLVKSLRKQNLNIGIVAVDPTSPYTGGSILGDRVRMSDLSTDKGVFIRSMGTRGHLGGISDATSSAVRILDVYGCDVIFIETVGVGQSEVDIVKHCDTTMIVTVPGLGDDIQAIKAGVMEIGDVFVINKADRDGAQKTAREIDMMLDFNKSDWRPPVLMAVAVTGEGIPKILEDIERHRTYMQTSGQGILRRHSNLRAEVLERVKEEVHRRILVNPDRLETITTEVKDGHMDPLSAAEQLISEL